MTEKEKKPSDIVIQPVKVERHFRETFAKVCKSQDQQPSQVLRKMMTLYIQKNGQISMKDF